MWSLVDPYCSFCGKSPDDVTTLVSGPTAIYICEDCTAAFREVQVARSIPPPAPNPFTEGPGVAKPSTPMALAVIPARYASTRFPGKPLAKLHGKPMVQHVFERCRQSGAFAGVFVATDDSRIVEVVKGFGGRVVMTSVSCRTGTDRVAEVARVLPFADILVNVQGDEPLIDGESLRTVVKAFEDPSVEMASLVRRLEEDERENPNVVKVALARNGDALYFSREDIPHQRDLNDPPPPRWAHVGLYGYRRETLVRFAHLPPTPLEEAEKLEQLRAIENGIKIRCLETRHRGIGVDTPEDLARAEALLPLQSPPMS